MQRWPTFTSLQTAQNGPVRLNLCGTGAPQPACTSGTGVLATGTNGTTVGTPAITFDSLLSAMRTGGAYVNVHTSAPDCTPGNQAATPEARFAGRSKLTEGGACHHRIQHAPNGNRPAARKEQRGDAVCSGAYRDRTGDPLLAKQVLSQLS